MRWFSQTGTAHCSVTSAAVSAMDASSLIRAPSQEHRESNTAPKAGPGGYLPVPLHFLPTSQASSPRSGSFGAYAGSVRTACLQQQPGYFPVVQNSETRQPGVPAPILTRRHFIRYNSV